MTEAESSCGALVHCLKECTDRRNCKGKQWNKYNGGYPQEELIRKYENHLWNKHKMGGGRIVELAIAKAEFCTYMENAPHSRPAAPIVVPLLSAPNLKKSPAEKQQEESATPKQTTSHQDHLHTIQGASKRPLNRI